MATETKRPKKRVASNRGANRRNAAIQMPGRNGAAKGKTGGDRGHSTKQKPLATMEDDDEQIPEIAEQCDKAIAGSEKRKAGKLEYDEALTAIGPLLHEHDLQIYKHKGKKFYLVPGVETVKVAVLDQGQG